MRRVEREREGEGEGGGEGEREILCFGGILIVDVEKEEAGSENEMKKKQTNEEGEIFLKPWGGAGSEHAMLKKIFVLSTATGSFRSMIIISLLLGNSFLRHLFYLLLICLLIPGIFIQCLV